MKNRDRVRYYADPVPDVPFGFFLLRHLVFSFSIHFIRFYYKTLVLGKDFCYSVITNVISLIILNSLRIPHGNSKQKLKF